MNKDRETWLVAVTAGKWQEHGIRSAQAAGLRIMALDGDPAAPGLKNVDYSAVVDVRSPEAVEKVVRDSGIQPSGAISFASEAGMASAGHLREVWNLPGPKTELTGRLLNKHLQRRIWEDAGLPNPRWVMVRDLDQAVNALELLGFPSIIKPVDSAGSRGVTRVDDMSIVPDAVERALANSLSQKILVESLMIGTEYAVDTFFHKGEAWVLSVTGKVKVPGSGGTVAMELASPALAPSVVDVIGQTAVRSLLALGYEDGPGHTEIILQDGNRPGLVETAGRGGGFMVFDRMVPLASGYDLAKACALQAVGREPPKMHLDRRAVVLRFFPTTPGVVRRLDGFEDASRLPGVEAAPFMDIGKVVSKADSDGDRLGYILSCADSPKNAQDLANRAEAMIHVEIS
ncbi:MAG: ATP-grasp domain-containing protein [Nitrospirae bacterium]|nr:ATP-grasp domain-containing protein [Magnetococcales bacterium]